MIHEPFGELGSQSAIGAGAAVTMSYDGQNRQRQPGTSDSGRPGVSPAGRSALREIRGRLFPLFFFLFQYHNHNTQKRKRSGLCRGTIL